MKQISFFKRVNESNATKIITLADALAAIQSNPKIEAATRAIITEHGTGIEQGFPDGKQPYQDAKRDTLPVVAFSGPLTSRSNKVPIPEDYQHSGLVTLDNDGNGQAAQQILWDAVQTFSFTHSAALSVSGALTGDFFTNIAVEIPDGIPAGLGLPSNRGDALINLHKLYHDYAAERIATLTGTEPAKGGSIKRLRYLAHDSNIFVRPDSDIQPITITELVDWQKQKQDQARSKPNAPKAPIKSESALDNAIVYANAQGYQFVQGQKHLFRTHVAIRLNWLGVPRVAAEALIHQNFPATNGDYGNCISYPYDAYAGDFAQGAHILAQRRIEARAAREIAPPTETRLTLKRDQYLSDHAAHLVALLEQHKQLHLQAGTGSGKSYAVAVELPKYTNGRKVVIACSLNAKVEKDAAQYGCAAVTGKMLTNSDAVTVWEKADNSPVVLCSYEQAHKLAARYEDAIFVVDEAHSLSYSYRAKALSRMWAAIQSHQLIAMSGTPLPYLGVVGFHIVSVTSDRPQIDWHLRNRIKGELATTAAAHIETTDLTNRRVVCLIQSKAQLEITKELLVSRGKCKDEEVVVLYSDDEVKAGKEFKQLIEAAGGDESFADAVRVVLTTSLIGEGVDVYSAMPVDFVTVHREQKFNPLQVVQFSDRWRIDERKKAYTYVLPADEPDEWKKGDSYQAELMFRIRYEQFCDRCRVYNNRITEIEDLCADHRIVDTGSEFSEEQRYIVRDSVSGRYRACVPSLIQEAESARNVHRTQESAVTELRRAYPYFEFFDERGQQDGEEQEDSIEAAQTVKEQRRAAKDDIAKLLTEQFDAFVYAVTIKTQDNQLKKASTYQPLLAAESEEIITTHPDLFGKFFAYAEGVINRLVRCRALHITDTDYVQIAVRDGLLTPAQRVSSFISGLRMQMLLLAYIEGIEAIDVEGQSRRNLTVQQAADAKKLALLIKQLQDKQGQVLTPWQLKRLTDQSLGSQRRTFTTSQARDLAMIFFDIEFLTDGPQGKISGYRIAQFVELNDYLTRYNVQDQIITLEGSASFLQGVDLQGVRVCL